MPPKKNAIEVQIPDVKIPEVKINIDSKVKKLENGYAVKHEVQQVLKYNNMYQRLNNAYRLINYDTGHFLFDWQSDERKQINQLLTDCLKLLDEFYKGKTKGEVVVMDRDQFTAGAPKIKTVFATINEKLDEVINAYDKHLKDKDKEYAKAGNYLSLKPNENYIYRHIAVDALKEISQICKVSSQDNSIALIENGMKNGMIQQVSVDDIFTGRQNAIRQAAGLSLRTVRTNGIVGKIPALIGFLKTYSEIGNAAADVMYKRLKDIDLSPYYTMKNGKYPTLTQEDITKLMEIKTTIKDCVRGFLDKVSQTNNETIDYLLVPETAGLDGEFSETAVSYRENLQNIVKDLDGVADEMEANLLKVQSHPEVYTLPIVFKDKFRDVFLGDTSLFTLVKNLSEFKNTFNVADSNKNIDNTKAATAYQNIERAISVFSDYINSLYEVGPDGYYISFPSTYIKVFQAQIEKVEKAIQDNEKTYMENISPLKEKEASKYFSTIKKIVNDYKAAAEKAEKETAGLVDGSFDKENVIFETYIDPNPEVRKLLGEVREKRINTAYEEQERQILSQRDERYLDACAVLDQRYTLFIQNRYFAKPANREAYIDAIGAFNDVVNKVRALYARDNYGGYTHYADETEKLALRDSMIKAQEVLAKTIKKSNIPDSIKQNLTAVNEILEKHVEVLNKTCISGKFNIAQLLDAGKFGFPPIEKAVQNAMGVDRYDWNNTKQVNDQQSVSYEDYRNPFLKIKEDLEIFRIASENPQNKYTDQEKTWLATIRKYIDDNFDQKFIDEYYKPIPVEDKKLGTDAFHYKLMTKEEQDKLREKFHGLKDLIQNIGGTDAFQNTENKTISALLCGVATFANVTTHRLDTFHWDLDVPVYTIQEAISGQADTHVYNFRNEITRFTRLHQDPTLANKLHDAGILLTDEEKFEQKADEKTGEMKTVRKMEKEGFSLLTTIMTLGQYERKQWPVFDYNDLTALLEKVKVFEEKYFRCQENGDYLDLPRNFEEIGDEGFEGQIRTYEQMKWAYTQIQYNAALMLTKATKYNEKNSKNPLPQAYIDGLNSIFQKGLRIQTLLAQADAHRTRPDMVNAIELMHSDPKKRENLWIIRQNKIFHRHRQRQGQIGGYRNLQHFEYKWDSELTYNGRFYDETPQITKGDQLNQYLDGLLNKYGANATEEQKTFVKALIEAVKNDPDKASEHMPTIDELANNDKVADGSILADVVKDLGLGDHKWWEDANEQYIVRNIVAEMSNIGISHVDAKERAKCGAKFGENLVHHYFALSNISEALEFDNNGLYPYERLISKVKEEELIVPGETGKTYKGILVEATPSTLGYSATWNEETKKWDKKGVKVISGKDILHSTNTELTSIDCFNNANFIESLANLQALCYLTNSPMPKIEDLKFAMETDQQGKMRAKLMSYMPETSFVDGDFEGKVKLEDIGVLPHNFARKIKNLTGELKKEKQKENLEKFANSMLDKVPGLSDEAKARMKNIIIQNAGELSKTLNDPKKYKSGTLVGRAGSKQIFKNGIRDKKILVTTDFAHLKIDKLSLKSSIIDTGVGGAENENRKNIFTQFAEIPEQVYANINKKIAGDENKADAYVQRFVNGVMRQVQSLNLEATLADIDDKKDEYWFHKDSEYYTNMHDSLHKLRKFEETGILEYTDDEGNLKKVNFKSMNLINGELDANIINHLTNYIDSAKGFVQEYITARKGKFFGPIHDMGARRLNAAKELNEKLDSVLTVMSSLKTKNPRVPALDDEPQVIGEAEKKFDDLPIFPKTEAPQVQNAEKEKINVDELDDEEDEKEEEKEEKKAKKDKKKTNTKKVKKNKEEDEDEKEDEKEDKKKSKGKGGKNK